MSIESHELIKAKFKPGCICKGIKLVKILEAIKNEAKTFEEVAEKTGIGDGSCGGKKCREKVRQILEEHHQS